MATNRTSYLKVSGELNGMIYKIRKGKNYISKKAAPGVKKDEAALKQQYQRTAALNELASELNQLFGYHEPMMKPSDFYQRLQSAFRKEPGNTRLFLLNRLRDMEVNRLHKLEKICPMLPGLEIKAKRHLVQVDLSVIRHPEMPYKCDCYFYEVLLLLWDDSGARCEAGIQRTSMIPWEGGHPAYELLFDKPDGTTDYLLALRISFGKKGVDHDALGTMGMRIIEVGSFNKQSQELLALRREEIIQEKRTGRFSGKNRLLERNVMVAEPKEVKPRPKGIYPR